MGVTDLTLADVRAWRVDASSMQTRSRVLRTFVHVSATQARVAQFEAFNTIAVERAANVDALAVGAKAAHLALVVVDAGVAVPRKVKAPRAFTLEASQRIEANSALTLFAIFTLVDVFARAAAVVILEATFTLTVVSDGFVDANAIRAAQVGPQGAFVDKLLLSELDLGHLADVTAQRIEFSRANSRTFCAFATPHGSPGHAHRTGDAPSTTAIEFRKPNIDLVSTLTRMVVNGRVTKSLSRVQTTFSIP